MASRTDSKKARLTQLLNRFGDRLIDEEAFRELRTELGPVSDSYLRDLLRKSGRNLSPAVEGVVVHSMNDLRRSLTALAEVYEAADRRRRVELRKMVIEAKQRLRLLVARAADPDDRQLRAEMLSYVLTWLENPEIFEIWVKLRERKTGVHAH